MIPRGVVGLSSQPGANRLPCVFGRALGARRAVCLQSVETDPAKGWFACQSPLARAGCARYYGLLRQKTVFLLKQLPTQALPDAQALRLEAGGLSGLMALLDPDAPCPDAHGLVARAQARFGDVARIPFDRVMHTLVAWRPWRVRPAPVSGECA